MNLSPLFVAFALVLLAILVIASIATTILGWVAVAQIRRSGGKLHGMWLAVFNGLLFPLLAVVVAGTLFILRVNAIENQASRHHAMNAEAAIQRAAQESRAQPTMIFGPVIELTLPMDAHGVSDPLPGLDPEDAATAPPPKTRITVIHDAAQNDTSLGGTGGNTYLGKNGDYKWKTMSADEAAATAARQRDSTGTMTSTSTVRRRNPPHVFVFRTPAGRAGLLEITDFPPGAVKLRYKLVQDAAAKASAPSQPAATFGPVIERSLSLHEHDLSDCLDLDSGELQPWAPNGPKPPALFPPSGLTFREAGDELIVLGSNGTIIQPLTQEQWETLTAAAARTYMEDFIGPEGTIADSGTGPLPWTYVFKTSGHRIGLLQVTEMTAEPRTVKIRYKLAPDAAVEATARSQPAPAFGPVIERVVNDNHFRVGGAIDFDTARLVTIPEDPKEADWQWAEANGIDALGDTSDTIKGLVATGGVIVQPVEPEQWDTMTASALIEAILPYEPDPTAVLVAMEGKGTLPKTYLFGTLAGRMGLLQITGFIENPPGVKIRYKLVQRPQPAAATSVPPAKTVAQKRLLELELKLAALRMRYRPTHPDVQALAAELSALGMSRLDLRDAAFWNLAEEKRARLSTDLERLRAKYSDKHPEVLAVQQQIDALNRLLAEHGAATTVP